MDLRFFFNERLDFALQLYRTASAPYVERLRKIEVGEAPFTPPDNEDGEPPFMPEWAEAKESIQVLSYSCVSMLSSALHLYLAAWVRESGIPAPNAKKGAFKKGWLIGYGAHFAKHLRIKIADCPADLQLLKEVVLARNRIEHPPEITSITTHYNQTDLKKLHHPFFVDEQEMAFLLSMGGAEIAWLHPPTLNVTEDKLLEAMSEAQAFVNWFDLQIQQRINP